MKISMRNSLVEFLNLKKESVKEKERKREEGERERKKLHIIENNFSCISKETTLKASQLPNDL